jgi:hypothetical protein
MGKFVSKFLEPIPQIQGCLGSRNEKQKQLTGPSWLLDLRFLADLTLELSGLNLELKWRDKHTAETVSSVRAFRDKLTWICDTQRKAQLNFPHLKEITSEAGS